ncbi:hypothetical protein ACQ4PT_059318 [Festuca glaucescens]
MLPYAPVQRTLEDVPVIELDVDEGVDGLRKVLRRKKLREFLISPAVYKGTPMTPPPHPVTAHRSYHRIKLVSVTKHGFLVELLICDNDMYLLAYRRFVPGKGWSPWQHFKNQEEDMPHFIQPDNYKEMAGITVTHKESITIQGGEFAALQNMFHVLANPNSSVADIEKVLFCAVILFCEVTRLEEVNADMLERLSEYRTDPTIADLLWTFMRSWQKLSDCGLDNRNRVKKKERLRVDPKLMALVKDCKITHIDQVIGPEGQLKLILLNDDLFKPYINVAYPADFRDHFPELDQYDAIMGNLEEDVMESPDDDLTEEGAEEDLVQEGAEEDMAEEGAEG